MLKDVLENENVRQGALWRRLSPLIYPAYCVLAAAYVVRDIHRGGLEAILPAAFALLPVGLWLPVRLGLYGEKYYGNKPEYMRGQYLAAVALITLGCFGLHEHGLSWRYSGGTVAFVAGLSYLALCWLPRRDGTAVD